MSVHNLFSTPPDQPYTQTLIRLSRIVKSNLERAVVESGYQHGSPEFRRVYVSVLASLVTDYHAEQMVVGRLVPPAVEPLYAEMGRVVLQKGDKILEAVIPLESAVEGNS